MTTTRGPATAAGLAHTFKEGCWCSDVHEHDGNGGCTICMRYVTHTDSDYVGVSWPCEAARLAEAAAIAEVTA